MNFQVTSHSVAETHQLGKQFAELIQCNKQQLLDQRVPILIRLDGVIGAGKTCFSQGFIRQLIDDKDCIINSPTYNIINYYQSFLPIAHIDCYRIQEPEELEYIGIRDIEQSHIVLTEWSELAADYFKDYLISIKISYFSEPSEYRIFQFCINKKYLFIEPWIKKHLPSVVSLAN